MGHSLVFMPECHSTNDEAARLLESYANTVEGTVIITNNQTSGRGQRGNTWTSESGMNLTFSLLMKPSFLALKDQFMLNKVFSLGLYDYLREALSGVVKVKWPNDMMVNNKKICGMLIENHIHGQHIQYSIVGIGLNVNQLSFPVATATSMKLEQDQEFTLEETLSELLSCLEKRYLQLRSGQVEQLDQDYVAALYWVGENHLFKKADEIFEGAIRGVDANGRLKVYADGTTEYFDLKQIQFLE
jgi:BirA family transcriptional regulator, biotin operon repressor / biotin---[acetyl-CoA-carboxylase] ligase